MLHVCNGVWGFRSPMGMALDAEAPGILTRPGIVGVLQTGLVEPIQRQLACVCMTAHPASLVDR